MNNIGIKNTATRNMISEINWYLGGWNTSDSYSNQIYQYERGTQNVVVVLTKPFGKVILLFHIQVIIAILQTFPFVLIRPVMSVEVLIGCIQ